MLPSMMSTIDAKTKDWFGASERSLASKLSFGGKAPPFQESNRRYGHHGLVAVFALAFVSILSGWYGSISPGLAASWEFFFVADFVNRQANWMGRDVLYDYE
jgi:hypothetical protein